MGGAYNYSAESSADYFSYLGETVYNQALEAVAMGVPRDEARGYLLDAFPKIEADAINDFLADALKDALAQGVEREDVDPSWF